MEELLCRAIEGEVETETRIHGIYKKLVRALHRSRAPSDDHMTKTLDREYRRHFVSQPDFLQPEIVELQKFWPSLAKLTPLQHLEVLNDLCSFQLMDVERFQQLSKFRDDGQEWRLMPEGPDKNGNLYWLIADCWLYVEGITSTEEKWECIAWNIQSWHDFLENTALRSSRRSADKELFRRIQDTLYPTALTILEPEERKRHAEQRKAEQELQRQIYLDRENDHLD